MPTFEIDDNKKYYFPEIKIIEYANKYLVITPSTANWIVLENEIQLRILNRLIHHFSINEVLDDFRNYYYDVNFVITQIEARQLYNHSALKSSQEENSLHLYLTNKCNLRCPHCYMFSGEPSENELTTKEIFEIIEQSKINGNVKVITLSGGEPSIREDFALILKKSKELGLEVKVLSNGINWTESSIKQLSPFINSIQISIDGFSELTNSHIRGKNHFEKALTTVDTLLKYSIPTAIAITPPLEYLEKFIDQYIDFANKLLSKYKDKPFEIRFSDEILHGRNVSLNKEEQERFNRLIKEIQIKIYGSSYDLHEFIDKMKAKRLIDNCMFGVVSIDSCGNVFACARIKDLETFSNIRETSIKEIYKIGERIKELSSIDNIKPCNNCEIRYICGGGCRIELFKELCECKDFCNFDLNDNTPFHRECPVEQKEHFYDLMLRSNEYLYDLIRE